ncbi:MAG: pdxH [Hydrocarboniphaga sp.]|uniref:pyridoxamine 5'-phosphate oxidase n=1 Tax=Hydrocarboniphaga sp. TaxID=2033016 RepID=UPI00262E9276|nr:pyridoxamine 5'-phosphate oxidase [Hydrocarboniphaga sp.]MDB5972846.1 pdxH [Hydrocarboniphaga sp.]
MSTLARQYTLNPPLDESELLPEPVDQLQNWIAAASEAGMTEPGAMTLATVGDDGRPSARIVLCKGFHDGGVCFFTNYESRKGRELAARPQASLVFWWDKLERQVRLEGPVERVSREQSLEYFRKRPRESQLGAYSSRQSAVVATREELDARMEANEQAFAGSEIPLPDSWGGYVLRPQAVEFWQGRRGRMHDRLLYLRDAAGWRIERLEP